MKITVERASWACPDYNNLHDDHGSSELLNERKCMCCLGFALSQCGIRANDLKYVGTPEGLPYEVYESLNLEQFGNALNFIDVGELDGAPTYRDSKLSTDAININDDTRLTLEEREAELTALFARHGHVLVFV